MVTSAPRPRREHRLNCTKRFHYKIPLLAVPCERAFTQIIPNPDTTSATLPVIGIVVAAVLAVLISAVILWVIRKKRADNRKGTNDSEEQKDDVTYTEVATHCKIRAKKNEVHDEDKVTYSSIR